MRRPRAIVGVSLVLLLGLFSGPLAGGAAAASTVAAQIVEPGASLLSWGFTPDPLTVKVGDTVTWTNTGLAPHTVTSDDGKSFDSGNIAHAATFHFTTTVPGTLAHHCAIHRSMQATLIVQAVPAAPTPVPSATSFPALPSSTVGPSTTSTMGPVAPTSTVDSNPSPTIVMPTVTGAPTSTEAVTSSTPAATASPVIAATSAVLPTPVAAPAVSTERSSISRVPTRLLLILVSVLILGGIAILRSRTARRLSND